ncbi:MAG: peptidylprolyl isomerase [Prevotella sp.]|nr:peptidylprolyl isomerase [Prevotella sp.]
MENNTINKYMAVAYKLYASGEHTLEFIEEATTEKPFLFISGFGITLDEFEKNVINLEKGQTFNFTLTKDQAYGDYDEERVVDLEREVFSINGHFDHENVFVDAILPLQNEDGQRFFGKVMEITDTHVKIDLNHPLAGKELNFNGKVIENREATKEEIQQMLNQMSGEGCGCGCDDCGGGCDDGHQHDSGCGCAHCHH